MRQVDIISTSDGAHYLEIGFDSNSLASFEMQLYITKTGKRAVDFVNALSLGYVSFMGGDIYLHNSDAVPRANFFGEQKDSKLGIVMNEQAPHTKILEAIGIFTDGEWEVESVTIQPDLNYPAGMYSKIPKSFFKKREGKLFSEFLRNMKTSTGTISAVEALNGEPLRANSAYIILKHTGGADCSLWRVDLELNKSR
jgi:hypothetical protein